MFYSLSIPLPDCLSEPLKSVSEKILTQLFGFYQLFSYLCRANLIDLRMEKAKGKNGNTLWYLILVLLGVTVKGYAQDNNPITVAPDSSDFVTASVLVATPTNNAYSIFGHAALRMECPVHHLDYVFTYEHDSSVDAFQTGIMGKAKSGCSAVPYQEYLDHYKEEGRGIMQYELNLTLEEERDLWRRLDEDMMSGHSHQFNLLRDNCLSTSIFKIEASLQGEYLDWGNVRFPMNLCYGDLTRESMKGFPWMEFVVMTFCGTAYNWLPEQKNYMFVPEFIPQMLKDARFVNTETGAKRSVLDGQPKQIAVAKVIPKPCKVTPTWAFGGLLLLTILLTLGEWLWKWKKLPRAFDIALFTVQTLLGLLLLYVVAFSELFGGLWNWYLVIFNPLPLWLFSRRRKNYPHVWGLYAVVLVLFILATPFVGVLDLPHQLITGTLLIRSINQYIKKK